MATLISPHKNNILAFEEARESITRLFTLKPFLAPADEETLSILMDKKLVGDLRRSLSDTKTRKVSSLRSILVH
ncbi:hypothetical protein A2609_03410 [Candidatus Kaiserbacteria bacterium RIFOXYD1_FULL_47_14]|uniref:Uncharacterized protein n=1 Tax=Candidatus Kaiserbacteria bacterium RIFOXYD1_FULL_47_14 TaxID=1798533 RepID=A0A1F6G442_9BACT|nr:MAG: hypothetical protein A2609_03410 [Candidatus Kaiserbacteria bacterium RIFOXYD1_FULL_47_14]